MSSVRVDIVSIGTLGRNLLWREAQPRRTAHATTVLIRSGRRNVLVDPGLPGQVVAARLGERAGIGPERIDAVFLTNFRPAHRAGLSAFPGAEVFIHEPEQQAVRRHLEELLERGEDMDTDLVRRELDLLELLKPAPEKLADQVDLFPLPGYTAGTCGLLIGQPAVTILLAGDAVATQDHFLAMQVLPDAYDVRRAQESMREVYEIADLVVPGHDNLFLNPRSMGMEW